jgi:dUTP pyrophosphatase
MKLALDVRKMHPDVLDPYQATPNSIGLDVHAYLKTETGRANNMILPPRSTRAVPTGLILSPPPGHAIFMCSRSGLAREHSIYVTNSPGVIDPDFRGEVMVLLYNGGHESYYIQHEDRVGQIVVLECRPVCVLEWADMPLDTERGDKGWGSSGR